MSISHIFPKYSALYFIETQDIKKYDPYGRYLCPSSLLQHRILITNLEVSERMNYKHLDHAFADAPVLELSMSSKIVLISDCHRGTGTSNDNFLKNQNLYFAALKYYYREEFTYIELGDGDELWENRSLRQIVDIHSDVFWLLSRFYEKSRLYLLYGNHDMIKRSSSFVRKNLSSYYYSSGAQDTPLFPAIQIYEGMILKDHARDIYLTHGHQVDRLNSTWWRVARFLVRYIWKPAEQFGVLDPTSAAKNYTHKRKTEESLTRWACDHKHILVTGHTHRPMIGDPSSPFFNTGSCVHPRCITCIEIEKRCLTLVKWTTATRDDMTLYVAREVLAGPVCIDDYNNE